MTSLRDLFAADGQLARAIPGYRPREAQLRMAEAVAEAFDSAGKLVVEAGTGTGKTFAYLVPALLSGRHVLVSTGTRTLQDQLFHRDLPMLAAALGRPVKVALLKGRANYLCRQRLQESSRGRQSPALARILRWSEITSRGDISELESVPDGDPVWLEATSTRDNCLGTECAHFQRCHVVQARREAMAADLVVVNHHLLLADMALREDGFGEILPGADAVVLDEAHQVPEIAAQFFGHSVSARQMTTLARDAWEQLPGTGVFDGTLRRGIEGLELALAAALRALASGPSRVDWAQLPDAFLEALGDIAGQLQALADHLQEAAGEEPVPKAFQRRCSELLVRLRDLQSANPDEGVKWVDGGARGFNAQFTPFEVADRLRTHMDSRPCAFIFTSATLAVGDDFSHFLTRIGAPEARSLLLPSPFDHERQTLLYLPRDLPDPGDRSHTRAVVEAVLPVMRAAGGRTFLLFTSHRGLTEGARLLREMLGTEPPFPVLVQGEVPRDLLLRRFRELGNAVLLGTGSFWEGVDVRGPALSLVAIDKLPFAPPDDPVLRARLEGYRRQGTSGFTEYQLPLAVLALKQGVGRLIRDADDAGVVMVCDPRLRTKGYGRLFIRSLPPMRRTQSLEETCTFIRECVRERLGENAA
ncbi:MAG: ATP-dependent DNA helicase [Gammaproteobacteria bacterium]